MKTINVKIDLDDEELEVLKEFEHKSSIDGDELDKQKIAILTQLYYKSLLDIDDTYYYLNFKFDQLEL